jgi:hypothetical protein
MKTGFLRSFLFSITILSLLLFRPVENAEAGKPDREPIEGGSFVVSDACEFDVLFEELTNREFFTTFYDKDGNPTRMLITGSLKAQLTNMSNNKSMQVNISGPGHIALNEDGTETYLSGGTWLIFLSPSDVPSFEPRMFLFSGRMIIEDTGGIITSLEVIGGRMINLCKALSD